MRVLKSKYLKKGIKMEHQRLVKEATINMCNKYNLLYDGDC